MTGNECAKILCGTYQQYFILELKFLMKKLVPLAHKIQQESCKIALFSNKRINPDEFEILNSLKLPKVKIHSPARKNRVMPYTQRS